MQRKPQSFAALNLGADGLAMGLKFKDSGFSLSHPLNWRRRIFIKAERSHKPFRTEQKMLKADPLGDE